MVTDDGREPLSESDSEEVDPARQPVVVPITDVIDLHSFPPAQIRDIVTEYLEEAARLGLDELRIIHGRGIGVQRRSIRALLDDHPRVAAYRDAPAEAGGWGATLVRLKRDAR